MRKGQTKGTEKLTCTVWTRIREKDYRWLASMVAKTKDETTCSLLRKMIQRRSLRIYTHDESLDQVMEELASLRAEIKAIGININQITRHFNSNPTLASKVFHAQHAFDAFSRTEQTQEKLLAIISEMAKKWLRGSDLENR